MVSIVAVHGLGATPSTTWSKALKLQESSNAGLNMASHTNGSENRVNWLSNSEMLPAIVTNARIMTFNYDSNWYGNQAVKVRLDHVANKLRRQVERERRVGSRTSICILYYRVNILGLPFPSSDFYWTLFWWSCY
jgi:hypothetical protein